MDRIRRLTICTIAWTFLSLSGCGDDAGPGNQPREATWRIDAAPDTLELEQTDEHVVATLTDLLVWRGDLVIVDVREANLKVYDLESGLLQRVIGRSGEGPGEFEAPVGAAVLPGDRLVVRDAPLQRVSFFDADGEFERSWSYPVISSGGIGVLDDGDLLVSGRIVSDRAVVSDSAVHRLSPEGERVRSYLLRPPPAPFPGTSIQSIRAVEVGGSVIVSETTSNVVRILDLGTGDVRHDTVGVAFYRPVSWTLEAPATPEEGMAWARNQMIAWHLRDLGGGMYAVGFEEHVDSLDAPRVHWAFGTADGPVATSEPTDARVAFIEGGRLYSVRIRDDGGAELVVGDVPAEWAP